MKRAIWYHYRFFLLRSSQSTLMLLFINVFLLSDPTKITLSPILFDNAERDSCHIIISTSFPMLRAIPLLS